MKRYWPIGLMAALLLGALSLAPMWRAEALNGTTLTAEKTAFAHYETTYEWTIEKSVEPASWDLFTGESGTSEYTIVVTKIPGTAVTEAWIDGEICVTNGGAVATQDLSIVDNVSVNPSSTVIASVDLDVAHSVKPVLDPGESYCYPYRVDIASPIPGATYKDTANITITNHSGPGGELATKGPSPSATSVMPSLSDAPINVDDTNGGSWLFNGSDSVSYDRTFTCDEDEGQHDNTATIRETGQSDDATVIVTCKKQVDSSTVTELHLEDGDDESPIDNGSAVANSSSLHDSATVTGDPDGPVPTGTVTFQFFASGDCTGDILSSSDVDLDGLGVAHPSQSTGALGAGSYSFLATYSGDESYLPSTADCEPFTVDRVVPTIEKTAETSYTRVCEWDIAKSADPTSVDLFTGDSAEISYEVVVSADCHDEDIQVTGDITIHNPSAVDSIDVSALSDSLTEELDCGDATIPATVGPGEDLVCSYTANLDAKEDGTNVATATIDGADYEADAAYTFGDPTDSVDESVDVTDSYYGDLGTVTEADSPKKFSYTRTVSAPDDCESVDNTASFEGTDGASGESSATVAVNCYELEVTKDANTSFDRDWTWTIEKTGDKTSAHLPPGGTTTVNYTVTLDATSEDSNWAVSGTITVHNPAPIDATLAGVSDVMDDSTVGLVDCDVEFPYILAAGGTLECTYTASLSDASDRVNTATATLQNTPDGETDFSGNADVDFDSATINQTDECVSVSDDKVGDLGTFCATQVKKHFEKTYSNTVGNIAQCTTRDFKNTATFTTNDGTTGSDDHTVTVDTPCLGFTQGYWGNTQGQPRIPSTFTYTLGLSGKCYILARKTPNNTSTILANPPNGLSIATGCGTRDSGINTNTLNVAFAQTLALRLNQLLVTGYDGQTIGGLFCTAKIGSLASLPSPYALSSTSTIQDVLNTANYLIGESKSGGIVVTQTQLGDLNALLGQCMNREA